MSKIEVKNTRLPLEDLAAVPAKKNATNPRYEFTELESAGRRTLRIEGQNRNTVFVHLNPTGFAVQYSSRGNTSTTRWVGFFDYYRLSREVVQGLMWFWVPPERDCRPFPGLHAWALEQTGKAIGQRLHAWYKQALREASEEALKVHRAAFAATLTTPELALSGELYEERYIVKDIISHRSAAAAMTVLEAFSALEIRLAEEKIRTSPEFAVLSKLVNLAGVELKVSTVPRERPRLRSLSTDEQLSMMESWRGLFSPTGEPYRSLDRTLMNLPGGVPPRLLPYLKLVHLSRPVSSRAELAVLTLYLQMSVAARGNRLNQDVFANANAERIRRSMGLVADHVRRPLSVRRTMDFRFLVGFLTDYPHEHRGNIVGLTEKSIRWHRCEQEREVEKTLSRLGGDKPTKGPPAPLPVGDGVEFLSTVGGGARKE